jgi:RNA polymerase sigma-70 factor (ECF subfamily)
VDNDTIAHLISEIKLGKPQAFTVLVNEYKQMVYSICVKVTIDKEIAEEAAQDTFIKAYQGLNKFKGESKFSTWLYRIAYFTAVNASRGIKVKSVSLLEASSLKSDSNSFEPLEKAERRKLIASALNYLSPQDRLMISLFYLEEFSIDEVSQITAVSKLNVKVKLHRIRKQLYNIISKLLKNDLNSFHDKE